MITTAQTMVQLMNEQRYEETVWSMERILMDGGSVSLELVDQLPNTWVCKSALLLQLQGGHCAYKGELAEAYALLKQAVQGFARMGLQLMMLDSMAQLAAVCLRIGEWQDAQTLLKFLHMEWERKESFVGEGSSCTGSRFIFNRYTKGRRLCIQGGRGTFYTSRCEPVLYAAIC